MTSPFQMVGQTGSTTVAVSALIEILENEQEEWSWRSDAAEKLGTIGNATAVPSLIRALAYNDEAVRRHAAKALRQIGSLAVPELIEAFSAAEGDLRRRVSTLLKQIGTPEALTTANIKTRRR